MNRRIIKRIAKRLASEGCRALRRYSHRQVSEVIRRTDDAVAAALVETPRTIRFWGADYDVTPAWVNGRIGDGGRLMFLSPLNQRPNYYVLRVPSNADPFDYIDEAYDVVEDQFGRVHVGEDFCDVCDDGTCELCMEYNKWPVADFDCGSSWDFWPR